MNDYLKIPIELCQFALTQHKITQAQIYISGLFLWPGKVHQKNDPIQKLSTLCEVSERTIRRSFQWLLGRNWMGEDLANGWLFFRALDFIHRIEGWKYGRAAVMQKKDLTHIKAFFAGAVMASLAKTGIGQRTERQTPRSERTAAPIPITALADTLKVSESTAFRLRKLADDKNFIKNEPNLVPITNWTPDALKQLKASDVDKVSVKLFGYSGKKNVPLERIRYKRNKLYLQEPNLIHPLIRLKNRRGLLNTAPMERLMLVKNVNSSTLN